MQRRGKGPGPLMDLGAHHEDHRAGAAEFTCSGCLDGSVDGG